MSDHPRIRDRANAAHYVWGDRCDGFPLVDERTLSIVEERVPRSAGEVMHIHEHATQFFYVLRGTATLHLAEGPVVFGAGQGVLVRAGEPHRLANEGEMDVEFLVMSTPSTRGDRQNLSDERTS